MPFPIRTLADAPADAVPPRFLVYTPPPPPLHKPDANAKEGMLHEVQRKWEKEVRDAKTSEAKTTSWAGVRGRLTRGVSKGMSYTTSSNLNFLGRVNPTHQLERSRTPSPDPAHFREDADESTTTKKTVPVSEIVLIYPPTYQSSSEAMRQKFVDAMIRTKSKAYRDSVIATGLLPVSSAFIIA